MRAGLLALLIALVACKPEEPEKIDTGPFDQDEDGYDGTEDCDDEDPNVFPGALEYCNDIDDNCDGDIDESSAVDMTTWCPDADFDGYGVEGTCKQACDWPGEGWADNTDDCLDTNAFVNPEGHEICDIGTNEDEDCNGLADDADPGVDASTLTNYYPDADSDDYGDASAEAVPLCDDPSTDTDRWVADDGDCDDTDRRVNPGEVEKAGNEADDDCDTCVDEDEDDGTLNWYYSADYDIWWHADWCHEIDPCPECDWSFDVQFRYDEDLSSGAADVGLNTDMEWVLGWGEAYPDTVFYYSSYYASWFAVFSGSYDSSYKEVDFSYGYWEGYGLLP